MSRFYPPYQFVPVTGTINADRDAHRFDYDEIANGASTKAPTVRHDLWHQDGLSGRLICTLRLDSPTLVGAVHGPRVGNQPVPVPQYEWRDRPALPANSLKGMISAVAEALSQSALRVLAEKRWYYRVQADPGKPADRYGTIKEQMRTTLAKHFAKIDTDLVPWTKDRNQLTPAELLFGTVQLNEKDENPDAAKNLAGRVRLRDAALIGEPRWSAEVTLRTLNSPNQPCPSMYYHLEDQRGAYLSKQDYRHHEGEDQIRPNGRKFYLHHPPPAANDRTDWKSHARDRHDKDRMRCQPMAASQWFVFPVDFDNLTPAELTLLLRALEPGQGFRHRLGLGKALGLGSVALAVEGLFLIDRALRYAPGDLLEPGNRYHRVWHPERVANWQGPPDWSAFYPTEWRALQGQTPSTEPAGLIDKDLIDTDTLKYLLAVGDPRWLEPGLPVRTPLLDTQTDPERRTYEWFVANEKQGHQALPAIDPNAQCLSGLYADMGDAERFGQFRDADIPDVDVTPPGAPIPVCADIPDVDVTPPGAPIPVCADIPDVDVTPPGALIPVCADIPDVDVTPPGAPIPVWLDERIDKLLQHQSLHSEEEALASKLLAEAVRNLHGTDVIQAEAVFDALNEMCRKHDLLFMNKALTIYCKLGFKPYYQ